MSLNICERYLDKSLDFGLVPTSQKMWHVIKIQEAPSSWIVTFGVSTLLRLLLAISLLEISFLPYIVPCRANQVASEENATKLRWYQGANCGRQACTFRIFE